MSTAIRAGFAAFVFSLMALIATPAPAEESAEAWKRAMALSDQQRYDEALAVIRAALERDPTDTDLRWLEAGVLGWSGHNVESVARYEGLIADHPDLADDVRLELASQRLWAGDPRGALADAEAQLEANPSDAKAGHLRALALAHADRYQEALRAFDELLYAHPFDVDLELDRAMLLGWMGKNERAVSAYEDILEEHPEDLRARIGLAQNENWSGNHDRAAEMFEDLLARRPEDPDILKGLAYANYWSDHPEAARTALDRLTALRPDDREAKQLSALLRFEEDPTLTAGFEASEDSDDTRIRTWTLEYRLPLPRRTAFSVLVRDDDVRDPGGTENPIRIGAGIDKRSDRWRAGVQVFHFDPRNDGPTRGLGKASLSYQPNGQLQFDLGFETEPILGRQTFAQDIRSNNGTAAVSWSPVDRVSLAGSVQYRDYSDGNRSTLASAGTRWELPSRRRSRLALLFGVDLLRTDQDLDNGYYDPERYVEAGPGAEWTMELRNRTTVGLRARAGYQREKGSDGDTFYNVAAVAARPLGRAMRIDIEVGKSNSSLSSETGFELTRGVVYLTRAF